MNKTNWEKIYKTLLWQHAASDKYRKNNISTFNTIQCTYNKKNEEYRLHKIEIVKQAYYLKNECTMFLKHVLDLKKYTHLFYIKKSLRKLNKRYIVFLVFFSRFCFPLFFLIN